MDEGLKRARKAALATRKPMPKDRTVEAWCTRDEVRQFFAENAITIRPYAIEGWLKNPVRLTITIHEEEDNAG
jgi:hypothetical protein